MKLKRCPRCRGIRISWTEVSEAYQSFDQDEKGIDPIGWNDHGPIVKVIGECYACHHRWTPRTANGRDAIMVVDLPGYRPLDPTNLSRRK